jgi:fructokinase
VSSDPTSALTWVIGEALIDIVQRGDQVSRHPGGSPLNVAVGLARLGNPTVLSTYLGHDDDGDAIAAHLHASGGELAAGSRTAPATSTAHATLGADGSATYEFDIDWAWNPPTSEVPAQVIHTGSLATFLTPGSDQVAQVFEGARADVFRSYDPNIRPALLPSRRDALDAFERTARNAHLVKLSDEDLDWLYPGLDASAGIVGIRSLGPAVVAVTGGSRGTTIGSVYGTVHVPAEPTTVADTVGAGDSWMSGFLHGVVATINTQGGEVVSDPDYFTLDRLGALTTFAARCAAITISRPGAQPPYLEELSPSSR